MNRASNQSKLRNSKNSSKVKTSVTRALLIIDNAPLRKKSIHLAQKWFNKIEETEQAAKKFQETDLKLFTDWYNLTLNPLIQEIDEARREFLELAEFHNLMVVVSKEKRISMPAAFLVLEDEENLYQNGDEKVRAKIDARRAKRIQILEKETAQESEENECNCEYCRSQRAQFQENSENKDDLDQDFQRSGNKIYDQVMKEFQDEEDEIQQEREKLKAKIQYYENVSDKKLVKIMRHLEDGYGFLVEAIAVLLKCSRMDLLRKIWTVTPVSLRTLMNKKAKIDFNSTIEEIMDEMETREEMRADALDANSRLSEDEDDEGFDDGFFMGGEFQHKKSAEEISEDDQIRIKSLFRKIVRRIHPDHLNLQGSQELKFWFDIMWKKVAEAHENKDLKNLTQIYYKIAIALKDYGELGVSELATAAKLLETEYKDLVSEYSNLRSSPAWNFSQLKDYRKLKKEQSKPFLQQQKRLNRDLEEIKQQRTEIERVAELIKQGKMKAEKKKPKRQGGSGRSRARRRRPMRDDFGQMNFGLD